MDEKTDGAMHHDAEEPVKDFAEMRKASIGFQDMDLESQSIFMQDAANHFYEYYPSTEQGDQAQEAADELMMMANDSEYNAEGRDQPALDHVNEIVLYFQQGDSDTIRD